MVVESFETLWLPKKLTEAPLRLKGQAFWWTRPSICG